MSARPAHKLRCAVYTRKSSEEGLEQEFNSLHAQRDAGLAYIASQKSEGWISLSDHYDDGGISGGTLERPALKRLLRDVEAGLIDVVVVYKIDRLSRSLTDFAKLVEAFERHNVTFVSVTQQFNTTTSMGRLTLNILLSFAQFEREVIGERIRDKFAASRKKGLWMGGWPPIGYEVQDRRLVVVEREAVLVRRIFDRFAKIGSALAVARELNAAGEVTKRRRAAAGSEQSACWYWQRGLTARLWRRPRARGRHRRAQGDAPMGPCGHQHQTPHRSRREDFTFQNRFGHDMKDATAAARHARKGKCLGGSSLLKARTESRCDQGLKRSTYLFRGWISLTQAVLQTSSAAAQQQAIDLRGRFEPLTERAESNSHRETGQEREKTASDRANGDQQLKTEKSFISKVFRRKATAGETVATIDSWRRGWDSNPRYGLSPYNGLANRRLQPLGHPSAGRGERRESGALRQPTLRAFSL